MKLRKLSDLEDGRYLCGDSGESLLPPGDFDMQKFQRGRDFFRDHIFSCIAAMTFSLVIGMSLPELLQALVFTGQSDTPLKAIKRYHQTFRHVALWHYGNVWDESSEASKSIQLVRNMHRKVRDRMEMHSERDDRPYLSQYDMGIVQSGFMGTIVMYYKDLGIRCTWKDIDDYIYFWYGIGHLLGVEEKYNICAHGVSQALSYCKEIEEIVIENLERPPTHFKLMTNAAINGFNHGNNVFSLLSFPVVVHMSLEAMSRKRESLSIIDTIRYYVWKFLFFLARNFPSFNRLVRAVVETIFDLKFI